jgi:xylan 1,4-beta-xylosidase
MVCAAVKKVHEQILASAKPTIPLIWSEFNATYANESPITDSIYMGPWMADTIRQCDGMVNIMSYWTFSDVFEEQGPVKQPFYGGYGLIAAGNIPKPAFDAFELLHQPGRRAHRFEQQRCLVTRRKDGTLVIALWNLVEPGATGPDKSFHLDLRGVPASRGHDQPRRRKHGDTLAAYNRMGSLAIRPRRRSRNFARSPNSDQPGTEKLDQDGLTVTVPPKGLAVVTIQAQ